MTHHQWRPQLRDPADEMALETAANARVGALVTYNLRDFIPANRFGIQVLTPEQAFKYFDLAIIPAEMLPFIRWCQAVGVIPQQGRGQRH